MSWICEALKNVGHPVDIHGWVETILRLKRMWFIVIRDRSGVVQVTYAQGSDPKIDAVLETLTPESAVVVTGTLIQNDYVKLQGVEVIPTTFEILSLAAPELPIDHNSLPELRLDWRFLDLRRPQNRLIFEIQTTAERAMRAFWEQHEFLEIHSPKLMGAPSESGAELFQLPYFDHTAYLAQSPQFYKQMAIAAGFDRVFEIGPVFRANPSFSYRHETEFISVDMEMSWIRSPEEIMVLLEKWLVHTITRIRDELGIEVRHHFGIDIEIPSIPFPRLTMTEAHALLARQGHPLPPDEDLDAEGEKLLGRYVKEQLHHDLVFVTDYPSAVRAFYHMRHTDRPAETKSFDLIWSGVEVSTGAQREHRSAILEQQAIEKGLSLDLLKDYLNCFKFGCPPHGGCGFGLARMLMQLLGLKNVREATFLSRNPNRLNP